MPIPVISSTQSVLYARQHEDFNFQPFALYGPTEWHCSSLPPGLAMNEETGLISGQATAAGIWVVGITSGNEAGTCPPVLFTIGIKAGVSAPTDNVTDLTVDLTTRRVALIDFPAQEVTEPLFMVKYGDDLLLRVRFRRLGAEARLPLNSLKFALKQYDPEKVLVESEEMIDLGDLEDADEGIYLVPIHFQTAPLKSALSDYEADEGTSFKALAEFEWVAPNSLGGVGAPATLRGTSRTFWVEVVRDLIPA